MEIDRNVRRNSLTRTPLALTTGGDSKVGLPFSKPDDN